MVLIRTILCGFLREVSGAVRSTIETALVATGKIDSIYIAIFAQSIGEVPQCFGGRSLDDAKAGVRGTCRALRSTFPCRKKR